MGVGDGKWEGDRALRRQDAGWRPQVHGPPRPPPKPR